MSQVARTRRWFAVAVEAVQDRHYPNEHVVPHSTTTTGFPSTSGRGTMPRPGLREAASRPLFRCGAPVAILRVT